MSQKSNYSVTSTINQRLQFQPHPLVRNRHIQTIFSSIGKRDDGNLRTVSQEMILQTAEGVRLQGFYTPHPQARGTVLMLHGWLGCMESAYNIIVSNALLRHRFSVFRLNFRDHGETHHLNPGLFWGDLLPEVVDAAGQVGQLAPKVPLHVVGASLGGNFALRIAWHQHRHPINNLGHVIAINPAIDPNHATLALDNNPIYLRYFRKRWRATLHKKLAAFPNKYDFEQAIAAQSCMLMTELLVKKYKPYPNAQSYFKSYTITPEMMAQLQSRVTILTALDDPIVPVEDFKPFNGVSSQLELIIQPYGGHVGFIDILPRRSWLTEAVPYLLTQN